MKVDTPGTPSLRAAPSASATSCAPSSLVRKASTSRGKPRLGGHLRKDSTVADVAALQEISGEQRLDRLVLIALALDEPDQPMGLKGVRRSLDQIVPKINPFLGADGSHLRIQFLQCFP